MHFTKCTGIFAWSNLSKAVLKADKFVIYMLRVDYTFSVRRKKIPIKSDILEKMLCRSQTDGSGERTSWETCVINSGWLKARSGTFSSDAFLWLRVQFRYISATINKSAATPASWYQEARSSKPLAGCHVRVTFLNASEVDPGCNTLEQKKWLRPLSEHGTQLGTAPIFVLAARITGLRSTPPLT